MIFRESVLPQIFRDTVLPGLAGQAHDEAVEILGRLDPRPAPAASASTACIVGRAPAAHGSA